MWVRLDRYRQMLLCPALRLVALQRVLPSPLPNWEPARLPAGRPQADRRADRPPAEPAAPPPSKPPIHRAPAANPLEPSRLTGWLKTTSCQAHPKRGTLDDFKQPLDAARQSPIETISAHLI